MASLLRGGGLGAGADALMPFGTPIRPDGTIGPRSAQAERATISRRLFGAPPAASFAASPAVAGLSGSAAITPPRVIGSIPALTNPSSRYSIRDRTAWHDSMWDKRGGDLQLSESDLAEMRTELGPAAAAPVELWLKTGDMDFLSLSRHNLDKIQEWFSKRQDPSLQSLWQSYRDTTQALWDGLINAKIPDDYKDVDDMISKAVNGLDSATALNDDDLLTLAKMIGCPATVGNIKLFARVVTVSRLCPHALWAKSNHWPFKVRNAWKRWFVPEIPELQNIIHFFISNGVPIQVAIELIRSRWDYSPSAGELGKIGYAVQWVCSDGFRNTMGNPRTRTFDTGLEDYIDGWIDQQVRIDYRASLVTAFGRASETATTYGLAAHEERSKMAEELRTLSGTIGAKDCALFPYYSLANPYFKQISMEGISKGIICIQCIPVHDTHREQLAWTKKHLHAALPTSSPITSFAAAYAHSINVTIRDTICRSMYERDLQQKEKAHADLGGRNDAFKKFYESIGQFLIQPRSQMEKSEYTARLRIDDGTAFRISAQ